MMQNWEHVQHIVDHMNKTPTDMRGADIGRIRLWTLEGLASCFRQTIVLSQVAEPDINALLNKFSHNYAGKVRRSMKWITPFSDCGSLTDNSLYSFFFSFCCRCRSGCRRLTQDPSALSSRRSARLVFVQLL